MLAWIADIPKLGNINIPQNYFSVVFDNLELHVFGDRSQGHFSAVAVLLARFTISRGKDKRWLLFVLVKTGVAAMKVMAVPKMKLQEALFAAQLKTKIMQSFNVTFNQVFM